MTRQHSHAAAPWGRVLVIMPTFNECESLGRVAGHLLESVSDVDLLVVDDNSPDGTGTIADDLAARDARVHVLHREGRGGLGRAYVAGFDWAIGHGYDAVVEMDADGSHPADRLPAMLDALTSDDHPGLVIGSRWVQGGSVVNWPKRREFLSRGANLYARLLLGVPARDITAGFRAYPTSVLRQLSTRVDSRGYSFQIEMTLHVFDAGFPIVEVPIEFREREAGVSKMNSSIVVEAMARVTRWGLARRFVPRHTQRAVESVKLS
ncbi:MAG TPA: polyprenol monophosphomannose synthase [Galbitalea sp.]|nr:polyprenol monophosphomannose synthase [Galbitalea sp.]